MAKGIKTGGRQKGAVNKDSLPLEQKARELGIDPFEVLLRFAAGDWKGLGYQSEVQVTSQGDRGETFKMTIDPAVRSKAAAEACNYLYPKKKAVELSTTQDQGFKIVIEDYSKKAK
jgi:hypothetical protein